MIEYNISLKPYNTFGIDVNAAVFSRFHSVEELKEVLKRNDQQLPLFILGGGSNILLTEAQNAFVLRNEISGISVVSEDESTVVVEAGSGVEWHTFVRYTVENNWGGIENLSLIPGSVGASPMQNIGAYGVEIKDVFVSLQAYHLPTGEVHTFSKSDCEFGYRESVFKRSKKGEYVILSVQFELQKNPVFKTSYGAIQSELEAMNCSNLTVDSISQAVMNIRNSKLPNPSILGNAGSFFKNPVVSSSLYSKISEKYPTMPHYPQIDGTEKLAAGWLIEQCGWKGKRVGQCGVHTHQALVLVNYGGATGKEIWNLSEEIIQSVSTEFGIELEREVNIY